jgi:3-dehydroquinate synthetase
VPPLTSEQMRSSVVHTVTFVPRQFDPTPPSPSQEGVLSLETVVKFGSRSYPYFAGSGDTAWSTLKRELAKLEADRFVLISEDSLPQMLLEEVGRNVSEVGPMASIVFPGGEPAKTVATLSKLAAAALTAGTTRRSCILAVGGGMVGNIAGLLATLLFRGIRLVQIPTTLLAQSDSVLSLKQAVNSEVGKNHLGAFYAPEFVWSNVDCLAHLPVIERQAAMCEVIKNVVAIRPEDQAEVASLLHADGEYTPAEYVRVIELAIEQKTAVMHDDAFEEGVGLVLEYGHTVGHAVETTLKGKLTHGLAVGIGMTVAAEVATQLGVGDERVSDLVLDLLGRLGAPTMIPREAEPGAIMERVRLDNKRGYLEPSPGTHDMILLAAPGQARWTGQKPLTQVPETVIAAAIKARLESAVTSPVNVGNPVSPRARDIYVDSSAELEMGS